MAFLLSLSSRSSPLISTAALGCAWGAAPRLFGASPEVAQTAPAADRPPPTVSDRLVEMTAIGTDGVRHNIKGLTGRTLLEALIRSNLETSERHHLEELSSCNGNCEVSVANEWLAKLPPRTAAETERLRQVSTTGKVSKNSRLGCQLTLSRDLDGITFAMIDERPWYTP